MILDVIVPYIFKEPTNLNPEPIPVDRQLGLTLYRLGPGVSYSNSSQLFGVLISLASETFNKVCKVLVAASYDQCVTLPKTDEEWGSEVKGFIENYEFPCVGAWDGFHVYVSSKLKSFYSLKKRYSMSNFRLAGFNKRFSYYGVGAPRSTHDCRMLRSTSLYETSISRNIIPDKGITLGDFGNIPLVTIGDTAFPKHAWLLKGYNEDTHDPKQRYFNTKLCNAHVVTKNAYGMLKGRFRILYEKTECRLKNLKYVIMACVMLHNLCISGRVPCLPRW